MGYLGQKYDKGLVIQRSPEGSAFQEEVNVVADGDTEVTPKVGGGLKKVNITGGGGSEVIANPELEGDEDALTGLEVDGTKYKVDASNYSKEYEGQDVTYKDERLTSTAYNRLTTTSTIEANENDGNGAVIETNTSTQPAWGEITTEVKLVDVEGEVYEGASITMEAHVDGETGDPSSSIDIKGNENGVGAQINIGGEADIVNINGQPYSPGTEVIANPTLAGTEANLTGLQVGNTKYKVPQGGGGSVAGINIDEIYAGGANEVKITRLTSTPRPLNLITDPSDLYDYFNSLYINIKEYCQGGYVYDSSAGASIEVDLSKGMYEGVSGTFNDSEIYGIVACVSTNEYGESRRELGTVYLGSENKFLFDSGFVFVEEEQIEQTVVSILQKSIGRE